MKTCKELYQEMLDLYTEKTGFEMDDAADLAVRLYAVAAQLESLYAYCDWSLNQSFPQTASGPYLDSHAALRGLSRKAGVQAQGTLRFSIGEVREDAVAVPAGTVCTTAGLVRFVTAGEAEIPAGSLYADVPARAEEPGTAGNAAAGTIRYLTQAPAGITACTNPSAFAGGAGEEDDESLRARVLDSFSRLPNGANKAFYEARVLAHAGVGGVTVLPRVNGVGTVGIVVATASGQADDALLEEIRADLAAVREIAVDVTVSAPEAVAVPVSAVLWPREGATFAEAKAAAEAALAGFFTGARLGRPVYLAELGSLLFATGLLENYRLTAPAADISIAATQLPTLGAVTLTEGT